MWPSTLISTSRGVTESVKVPVARKYHQAAPPAIISKNMIIKIAQKALNLEGFFGGLAGCFWGTPVPGFSARGSPGGRTGFGGSVSAEGGLNSSDSGIGLGPNSAPGWTAGGGVGVWGAGGIGGWGAAGSGSGGDSAGGSGTASDGSGAGGTGSVGFFSFKYF